MESNASTGKPRRGLGVILLVAAVAAAAAAGLTALPRLGLRPLQEGGRGRPHQGASRP